MSRSWLSEKLEKLSPWARSTGASHQEPMASESSSPITDVTVVANDKMGPTVEIRDGLSLRSRAPTLNRLPDISDWRSGSPLVDLLFDLRSPVMVHRKSWEYALCIQGLTELGAVQPEARAIAIGAGYETPLFYFANRIAKMVATDLYDNPEHEGRPDMLTTPESYAPFDYRRDNLDVLQMPGDDIKFEDESFDFAFCLSSIEHFGSRETQRRALSEIRRVLKPGGTACIITEVILEGPPHHEYFTPSELSAMFLRDPELRLVGGDLSLAISREMMKLCINIHNEYELGLSPHIVLTDGDRKWTSCSLFLQKSM